jgi:hypothetical protein
MPGAPIKYYYGFKAANSGDIVFEMKKYHSG